MIDIKNNDKEWKNVLKEFKIHLVPILNPEGYLISFCAIRKLIPIELSGMGGNPIAPYGNKKNYTNTIKSNLDAIKYTLNVASIAQMISEASYQLIAKIDPKAEYQTLTEVQDIIYKEFSMKVEAMKNIKNKEEEENER